jgi:hypothetical protein
MRDVCAVDVAAGGGGVHRATGGRARPAVPPDRSSIRERRSRRRSSRIRFSSSRTCGEHSGSRTRRRASRCCSWTTSSTRDGRSRWSARLCWKPAADPSPPSFSRSPSATKPRTEPAERASRKRATFGSTVVRKHIGPRARGRDPGHAHTRNGSANRTGYSGVAFCARTQGDRSRVGHRDSRRRVQGEHSG